MNEKIKQQVFIFYFAIDQIRDYKIDDDDVERIDERIKIEKSLSSLS